MIKTIIVPAMGDRGDETRFATALAAARRFGAHIEFLHLRLAPDQAAALSAPTEVGIAISGAGAWDIIEEKNRRRASRAHKSFAEFCEHAALPLADRAPGPGPGSVSAAWRETIGEEIDGLIDAARLNDLLVIRSGPQTGAQRYGLSPDAAGAVLLRAGRPLLLAPARAPSSLGGTIVVAWKDAADSARAVTAAMPFLGRADRVVILNVEDDAASATGSVDALVERLRWHGLPVIGACIAAGRRSGIEAVVAQARALNADLLVMGGYGHGRMRELVFGGFTRHVLTKAELPVFLFH